METQEQVMVPQESNTLAQGLKKLVLAVLANHKALSGSMMAEVSADVTAAVADLGPVLGGLGMLSDEMKADPLGMVEAFMVAGLDVAKVLMAPAPASAAPVAEPAAAPTAPAAQEA